MSPSLQVAVSLEEPSPAEEDGRPEKPVCEHCRSSAVTFDASACWDAKEQQFEYDILFDEVYCQHCEGKQRVDWIPV